MLFRLILSLGLSACCGIALAQQGLSQQLDAMGWRSALSKENGLDRCAGVIALEIDKGASFRASDWPIICNNHRNDPAMQSRVDEIKKDLESGRFSPQQLDVMRSGRVPIGAPKQAILYVLGAPSERRRSTTEAGVQEAWLYETMTPPMIFTIIDDIVKRIDE